MDDPAALLKDFNFITDCARYLEGLLDRQQIRRRYHLTDANWDALGQDDDLVLRIEDERLRRLRGGQCARERAQIHHADAPSVLGKILQDDGASPRHRIESARELRAAAGTTPARSDTDRHVIVIDLGGGHVQTFGNFGPDTIDATPEELLPAITGKAGKDGGDNNGGAPSW